MIKSVIKIILGSLCSYVLFFHFFFILPLNFVSFLMSGDILGVARVLLGFALMFMMVLFLTGKLKWALSHSKMLQFLVSFPLLMTFLFFGIYDTNFVTIFLFYSVFSLVSYTFVAFYAVNDLPGCPKDH